MKGGFFGHSLHVHLTNQSARHVRDYRLDASTHTAITGRPGIPNV